jgi:acyl-CoA thioester hydrolase
MSGYCARLSYRVPYADTDQMGVVYYGNYLTYFERARNELLRDLGLPYSEIERRGFGLPVLSAHVDYKAPARYDDLLEIRGWVGDRRAVRVQVNCAVYRADQLLAEGHTVHAFVELASLRPTRFPPDLAKVFDPEYAPPSS